MSTTVRRVSAVLSFILSLTLVTTALGATVGAATAAPSRIGSVLNLKATSAAASAGGYRVTATWEAPAGASSYAAKFAYDGKTVTSGRITTTSWSDRIVAAAGTQVVVTVTAFNGKRRSKPRSVTIQLADVKAPTGSFTVNTSNGTATVTQTAIGDDVTADADIRRFIDWGAGAGFVAYPDGLEATHTYTASGRYLLRVRLVDAANNAAVLPLGAAVVGDVEAPVGTHSLSTATAWTGWTAVRLVETSVSDDMSPGGEIVRTVDWGDETNPQLWKGTAVRQHVYAAAGVYKVTVGLEDEAGNESETELEVEVSDDTVAPAVTWRLPKRRLSLRAWRYIRGSAADNETDVAVVRVKMVQRRAGKWVAYRSGRWVPRVTRNGALRAATARQRTVSDTDRWRVRAPGLRRGLLVYRAWATDEVGNVGPKVTRKQRLTRR